jgi:hypothetical protein
MKYHFIAVLLLFLIWSNQIVAQGNLSDSVYVLYQKYFEMARIADQYTKMSTKVDSVASTLGKDLTKIDENYKYFNEVLDSNNKKISSISETQLYTNKTLVERNMTRAVNSTDFVEAAATALNALDLTNQIFAYTDKITALNNPENTDLGFSLNDRINKILEDEIFQGRQRVNKIRKDKFLQVVDNIIKNPITTSLTDGIPVVGSIRSVVEMVVNVSLQGEEVSLEDVTDLKRKLSAYVEYYQGLEKALRAFENKVGGIDMRTEALKLLLKNYIIDRVKTIYPETDVNQLDLPLNTLLNDYYNYRKIKSDIDNLLIKEYKEPSGNFAFAKAINDQRLRFPDFAVGQSRFITDEIESINSEYEAALSIYQTSIKEVLEKSRSIGNDAKIDQKIKDLEKSKEEVIQAIKSNINLVKIKRSYQSLLGE